MGLLVFEIIKIERVKKKLTQNELAKKLKISQTHYARLERGERELSFKIFSKIVEILDIDSNQILSAVHNKPIYDLNKSEINLLDFKNEIIEELEKKIKNSI
ncbi:helix-turn-helix domain-containing protein [Flavobacterium lacus]|uniref:Helix-turn-helix protein n=1 Tax=Flavobacterium lacus TaxID=1353778 RepID=A0A328X6R2_9FLAO|nr:helix-turn-helix transcriptional regulator [Flavobacterium lacus]RAR51049.1 helix-turn-helix protein [Flavobacterium lacus]